MNNCYLQQKLRIVDFLYVHNHSYVVTRPAFNIWRIRNNSQRPIPCVANISQLMNKLENTGSLLDQHKSYFTPQTKNSKRIEDNVVAVLGEKVDNGRDF